MELITGRGRTIQSENDGRFGRFGRFYTLVAHVEHGLDASPARSGDDVITHPERTIADQNRRDISTSLIQTRLDDATRRTAIGISFQVKHVGLEEYFLQQFVDTYTFFRTNFLTLVFSTPLFNQQVHLS